MLSPTPLNPRAMSDIASRWENHETRRFYEATTLRNLFGEWEVLQVWGRIGSLRGGYQCHPVADKCAADHLLAAIAKLRERRGYAPRTN